MGHNRTKSTNIWDKLEDLSDRQDWWVEDVLDSYACIGLAGAILKVLPLQRAKELHNLLWDIRWTRDEIKFYDDWACELGQSKLEKNKRLMELATLVHKEACYKNLYNGNRYFWMPSK